MQIQNRISVLVFIVFATIGVNAQNKTSYQQEMDAWYQKRINALKAEDGWLNLTGLFWLKPGKNEFGSDTLSQLIYQQKGMPKNAGYFLWENEQVIWVSAKNVPVKINGKSIVQELIFEEGKATAPLLSLGTLRWNIIQREEKVGIRLRDLAAPIIQQFKGVEHFKTDSNWRVTARLETSSDSRLFITNVLGQTNAQSSPGKLVFMLAGKEYKLDAIEEGDQLFILFGDATSGKETYPAGRFMYTNKPDANGNIVLDFNKSFNPPCAFSPYATCPLPPKQNILPIAIYAGEKNYHVVAAH